MDDTECSCAACCRKHPKSEMHYRISEYYPYRDFNYYCTACNDKRKKREALKATVSRFNKSPSSTRNTRKPRFSHPGTTFKY